MRSNITEKCFLSLLPFLTFCIILTAFKVDASTYTWTGANSGDWGDSANWDSAPTFAAGHEFLFYAAGATPARNGST